MFVTPFFTSLKRDKELFPFGSEGLGQGCEAHDVIRMPTCVSFPARSACNPHAVAVKNPNFHVFFTMRKKEFHDGFLCRLRISRPFNGGNFALRLIEER